MLHSSVFNSTILFFFDCFSWSWKSLFCEEKMTVMWLKSNSQFLLHFKTHRSQGYLQRHHRINGARNTCHIVHNKMWHANWPWKVHLCFYRNRNGAMCQVVFARSYVHIIRPGYLGNCCVNNVSICEDKHWQNDFQ